MPDAKCVSLDSLDYRFDRKNGRVTFSGAGDLYEQADGPGGSQWSIPDTVGHLSLIITGTNIGAVRTPFCGKRVQIDGPNGIAVVIQLDRRVSASAHLAPYGAIMLAAKLLEEAAAPYAWRCGLERCPPALGAALAAVHDAVWEVKTMPRPIP